MRTEAQGSPSSISPEAGGRRIRVLPPLVASQIAAGEVVERPASVVKELVENALDAGATKIVVELEQGGIELVRVTDDGGGMSPEDLPLALAPHATSKIASVEDLDHIATLGFRGEAVASIASVSRMSIRSRVREAEGASIVEAEGDRASAVRPIAGPIGTQVSVRNLFFNTPARRKFLRTVGTEQGRCADVLTDLAIAHPAVGFTLTCDGRTSIDVPSGQSPRERVLTLLGKELASELLEVNADRFDDSRGIALWGLVGRPSVARPTSKGQHVLVNGRAVRDRTIQHALSEGFRGLIEHSRYPLAVLMIEMSPAGVDVNVHPAKAEVRFRDSSLVHSVVLRAVREALRAADLTPAFTMMSRGPDQTWQGSLPGPGGGDAAASAPSASDASGILGVQSPRDSSRAFVDFFRRFTPAKHGQGSFDAIRGAIAETAAGAGGPTATEDAGGNGVVGASGVTGTANEAGTREDGYASHQHAASNGSLAPTPATRILQVHKSYLVTQDEQGMVIIDQHALHERAMFEYLIARVAGSDAPPLESQRLLTPAVVQAPRTRVEKLEELRPLLTRIGIAADALGPTSVGIQAFPTFLFDRGVDPVELMDDLLEKAEGSGFTPTSEETMRDVLDMMACKAAVKAGDRLSEIELAELVKLRGDVERSSNCPHGRPTSIRLTIAQLEKLFGRS